VVIINYKVIIESRTIEMRRAKIKVRTYENAKVFLEGTAGRGKKHWASTDFLECKTRPDEITYFSGNNQHPAFAVHGDHVHIIQRSKDGTLANLDVENAERAFFNFVEKLGEKGIKIKVEEK